MNSYYDANAAKTKLYVEGICMHIKYETLLPDVNALSFPSRGAGGGTNGLRKGISTSRLNDASLIVYGSSTVTLNL